MPAPDLTALIREWGPDGRRIERVANALAAGASVSEAVALTGAARKTVEEVAAAIGGAAIAPLPDDPDSVRLAAIVEGAMEGRPAPDHNLDHVAATLDTLVRRALLLNDRFRLEGAHVLFLGDHDLTSVAVAAFGLGTRLTVVDLDTRVLAHIAQVAPMVTTLAADLREGLPADLVGSADIVFTDPPYSPTGVALFVAVAVQALRDHDHGRIVLAHGYGEQHPALGFKVQDELNRLRLVVEALFPDFNHYEGAEAIGSRSDLYLLRPTRRSGAAATRVAKSAGRQIYSKGPEAQPSS